LQALVLVPALIFGLSMAAHASAARDAAKAECVRLAAAQAFGDRHIQRRNFIQDCLIDRGFNT
jgi:hypothetical protein